MYIHVHSYLYRYFIHIIHAYMNTYANTCIHARTHAHAPNTHTPYAHAVTMEEVRNGGVVWPGAPVGSNAAGGLPPFPHTAASRSAAPSHVASASPNINSSVRSAAAATSRATATATASANSTTNVGAKTAASTSAKSPAAATSTSAASTVSAAAASSSSKPSSQAPSSASTPADSAASGRSAIEAASAVSSSNTDWPAANDTAAAASTVTGCAAHGSDGAQVSSTVADGDEGKTDPASSHGALETDSASTVASTARAVSVVSAESTGPAQTEMLQSEAPVSLASFTVHSGAELGAEPEAEMATPKKRMWNSILPRSIYKGVVWVHVHEAAELQPKVLGTRDPYIKLRVGSHVECTSPVVNSTNPVYNEELCMLVQDAVNDTLELQVLQNDVAMGRYVTDDCIGSYTFNLKQLISDRPEQKGKGGGWSGWVTLANARRGKVRLSLTWEMLPDAIRESNLFAYYCGGACDGKFELCEDTFVGARRPFLGCVAVRFVREKCAPDGGFEICENVFRSACMWTCMCCHDVYTQCVRVLTAASVSISYTHTHIYADICRHAYIYMRYLCGCVMQRRPRIVRTMTGSSGGACQWP
jgi:hypothetical protein